MFSLSLSLSHLGGGGEALFCCFHSCTFSTKILTLAVSTLYENIYKHWNSWSKTKLSTLKWNCLNSSINVYPSLQQCKEKLHVYIYIYTYLPVRLVKLDQCWVASNGVLVGTQIPGGGGWGRLYLTLHCHHQNDFCIKMSSDESQFHFY